MPLVTKLYDSNGHIFAKEVMNVRTEAKPGFLTVLSAEKIRELNLFDLEQTMRYYVALSARQNPKGGMGFGLYVQSNIRKEFPRFAPPSFVTKAGQHISMYNPGVDYTFYKEPLVFVDGQEFPSNQSFHLHLKRTNIL